MLIKPDVLAIGETWLRKHIESDLIGLPDYALVRSDRAFGSRGGGVALYIIDSLSFSLIELPASPPGSHVDIVAASLRLNQMRLAVVCVYWPPCSPRSDLDYIETCLCHVASVNCDFVCLGDLNVNMLSISDHSVEVLRDMMSHLSLTDYFDSYAYLGWLIIPH